MIKKVRAVHQNLEIFIILLACINEMIGNLSLPHTVSYGIFMGQMAGSNWTTTFLYGYNMFYTYIGFSQVNVKL